MAGLRGAEACQGGWVDEWRGVARGGGLAGRRGCGVLRRWSGGAAGCFYRSFAVDKVGAKNMDMHNRLPKSEAKGAQLEPKEHHK